MKAWYCGGGTSALVYTGNIYYIDDCPNVGNLQLVHQLHKLPLLGMIQNGAYSFCRLKSRVDTYWFYLV